jgi:hypothetical protein
MQSNDGMDKIAWLRSAGRMFNDGCCCRWFCGTARAALLAIVFAGTVVFATGCSSTGGGTDARFIASDARPGVVGEDDAGYQPPRSPSFNDLTGG